VPLLGEWVTLPLIEAAGGQRGDAIWDRFFHPNAQAVLERCNVLLRIGGDSAGADAMVKAALARGLAVHHGLESLKSLTASSVA
jgi:ADP-ribose pyrophosphatase